MLTDCETTKGYKYNGRFPNMTAHRCNPASSRLPDTLKIRNTVNNGVVTTPTFLARHACGRKAQAERIWAP